MRVLDRREMSALSGGDLAEVIDGACASIGLGAVFFTLNPTTTITGAFCAGWVIGRLLG